MILWGLALVILLLDFFSKRWIVDHLSIGGAIPVFENFHGIDFSILHAVNRGAAWGVFANYPTALLILRIAVALLLFVFLLFGQAPKNRRLPFLLILSGATGNILDFFLYGHVVDFFAFTFWGYLYPVFNVADSAIFCGVALLVLQWAHVKSKHSTK